MRDVDAAWLAAAIDGEGTLSVVRRGKNHWIATIRVFNNNLDFIKKVKKIIGDEVGGICERKNKLGNITFNYGTQRKGIIKKVIKDIFPYLIVKKHNARICLDFLKGKIKKDDFSNGSVMLNESRPNTSIGARNWLKGNYGDSDGHRRSALCASVESNSRKGNRGNLEQHKRAGLLKGKRIQ
jgi:hypothetical protein